MSTITSTKLFKNEPWGPDTSKLGSWPTREAIIGASARDALSAISTIGDGLSTMPTFKPASLSTSSLPTFSQAGNFREKVLALTSSPSEKEKPIDQKRSFHDPIFSFPSEEELLKCLNTSQMLDPWLQEQGITSALAKELAHETRSFLGIRNSVNLLLADFNEKLDFSPLRLSILEKALVDAAMNCKEQKAEALSIPMQYLVL